MTGRVNPDMLMLAREARRISQEELARAIGVTQGKVSKYENGLLEVSEEDLAAIARVTGYHASLFRLNERIVGLGSSALYNRKRESTPVTAQKEIQAKVNITRFQISRLLRAAQMNAYRRLERFDPDQNGGPRGVAQRLRAAWSIPMGPIQNMTEVIESAGGLVILCDFGTDKIDGIHTWIAGESPMFFMNAKVSGDRHRFNLAHELGHAVMHEFPQSDIEGQANEFAAEFLIPSVEIRPELQALTIEKLARLKQRWKVSMASLVYQAHDLGCISDHQYRAMFARFSALGYHRNEPIEVKMEEPALVGQMLQLHREGLKYTDADLRALLMADAPDFIQLPTTFKFSAPVKIEGEPFKIDAYHKHVV